MAAVLALAGCARVAQLPHEHVPDARSRCIGLADTEFDGAGIVAAEPVPVSSALPGYCRVRGTIGPDIRFEARLPLTDWNGNYYQSGCGGYCGSVLPDKPGFSNTINEALKLGYATITTDNGHVGGLGDASWAPGNAQAVTVYAHRGIALTHRFGTALTRGHYGMAPERAYFGGCSNGGRMAAMAAQRYPTLFDGILGGAAVLELSRNGGIHGSWVVQSNTRSDGDRILTRANFAHKLPALEAAVLGQCDRVDGEEDGLISEPRRCRVDVDALPACGHDNDAACFNAEERAVLERWYRGARDADGNQLYPGMPPGSERFWRFWFLDGPGAVAPGNALGGDYAKFLGFPERIPPGWSVMDFDFDTDPGRLQRTGELLDAVDPDLTAFRDAGGKFLMWHGWADPLVLPDQSVAYYERVAETMGGTDATRSFFRLFMLPGHGHCWELPSPTADRFNPILTLQRWVEAGEAPDAIRALAAGSSAAKRPALALCPHPARAVPLADADSALDTACPILPDETD